MLDSPVRSDSRRHVCRNFFSHGRRAIRLRFRARPTLIAGSESSRIVKSGCKSPQIIRCNSSTALLPSLRPPPWYASVESVKRSHKTICPRSRAGWITSAICCAREANINAISAIGDNPSVFESSNTLPDFLPRRRSSRLPRFHHLVSRRPAASPPAYAFCVLFPVPSRPSKVIKVPCRNIVE